MQDTVIVTLELALKPELVEDFCEQIPEALKETRAFPGFVDISIRHNADDPNRVIFIEEWASRADHEAYVAFRTQSGVMDQMAAMLTSPLRTEYWDRNIL